MSDRLAIQKQMLASHTKILERYIREGAHDKVAEWQPKVDKLRQQIDEMEGNFHGPQGQQQFGGPNPSQQQFGGPPQQQFGPNPSQPQFPQHGNPNPHSRPTSSQGPNPGYGPSPTAYNQPQGPGNNPTQFGSPSNPQLHVSATEKRANEILSDNNLKLTSELAVKETIIEGKQRDIEKLNANVKGLSDQLGTIKASALERQTLLEREIALLKSEIEEGKITKVRELEQQRASMQRDVDGINKQTEEKDNRISVLNTTLQQIKSDQENESINLGIFITKTINTAATAANASNDCGNTNVLVLESTQDVGFAQLSIKTAINGDVTSYLRV